MDDFKETLEELKKKTRFSRTKILSEYDKLINEYDENAELEKKICFYFKLKNFSYMITDFLGLYDNILRINIYLDVIQKTTLEEYYISYKNFRFELISDFESLEKSENTIKNFSKIDIYNSLKFMKNYKTKRKELETCLNYFLEYIENVQEYWYITHKHLDENPDMVVIKDDMIIYKHKGNLKFESIYADEGGDQLSFYTFNGINEIDEKHREAVIEKISKYYPELLV